MQKKKYISSLLSSQDDTVIDLRNAESRRAESLKNWISFPVSQDDLASPSRIHQVYFGLNALITAINARNRIVLVCRDGGLISKTVWEMIRTDFTAYIYKGGFRQLRKSIRQTFEKPYSFYSLKGPTGSGKTEVIDALKKASFACLNLEAIAGHAGSVFGNIESGHQPNQFEFEFKLANQLLATNKDQPIIVEDEQVNLGQVSIPRQFWTQMQKSTPIYIGVSKNARVDRLVKQYAGINDEYIAKGISILTNKLGHKRANELITALKQQDYKSVANGLIDYYDNTPGYSISAPSDNDFVVQSDDVAETVDRIIEFLKRKSPGDRGH